MPSPNRKSDANWVPAYARLSLRQIDRIHEATLRVMENTGMRFYEPEAVALLQKAGASVEDGNLVKIPPRLVEWALSVAPRRIPLFDQDGAEAMCLEGRKSYYGPGSDCPYIWDHRAGARRKAVLSDVAEGASLCDALPNLDFVMSMFIPSDVPPVAAERRQMETMLLNTRKPIVFVATDLRGCIAAVKMAETVRGGSAELRQRPSVACYINVSAPLRHNKESLQKLLYLSEQGIPFVYAPGNVTRGMTTPVTVAGFVVMQNACQLGGVVLAQLKREGAPVLPSGGGGGVLDMRTAVGVYVEPNARGQRADLYHYYQLPMFGTAGCSDAKLPDMQAGIEAALSLVTDALSGVNLVHDLGYLESGLTGSLAMLVVCDEIAGWIKHFVQPTEVNDATLALDLIAQVGAEGHFLDTRHTYNHFREDWFPRLFDRRNYDGWRAGGAQTLLDRANTKAEKLLAGVQPRHLPEAVMAKLATISVG